MKRFSPHHGLQKEPRTTRRQRLCMANIMDSEDACSHVDLFEDGEVKRGAKALGDRGKRAVDEHSLRERLQRHRVQIAGNVWIPDTWGQEDRLKEWVDPKAMDQALALDGLMSARIALVEDQPKRMAIDLGSV